MTNQTPGGSPAQAPRMNNIAETMREIFEDLALPLALCEEPTFEEPVLFSHPKGRTIEDITAKHRDAAEFLKPARRRGTAVLGTLESLIGWANRFKGETSALFADTHPQTASLTCVADYHGEGAASFDPKTGDPLARHLKHRGVYPFPVSPEWKAWTGIQGKALDKDEFGQFLEDHIMDVLDPTPYLLGAKSEEPADWERKLRQIATKIDGRFAQVIDLVQLSKSFTINESSNLTIATNRQTGEAAIQFLNEHRDTEGQPVSIPDLFLVAIPVFRSGAAYRLVVRLKYRKAGSTVKWFLTIHDAERAFDDAIGEAIATAREATGLPLFEGKPETL